MADKLTLPISFEEYDVQSKVTDRLDDQVIAPVAFGLYGEVGSVMAILKKSRYREPKSHPAYFESAVEEFGDILWYYTSLCRRHDISLSQIAAAIGAEEELLRSIDPGFNPSAPLSVSLTFKNADNLDNLLSGLGKKTASLLDAVHSRKSTVSDFVSFFEIYLRTVQASHIPLSTIMHSNVKKIASFFLLPKLESLPTFDDEYEDDERIPANFEIEIRDKPNGKCYMRWNGVFIGEPLTDNIEDVDGYRLHDVFHLAHAAILHWSPTFRALIRHKRKCKHEIDENQDGGRAIVIEEGLTAYIFSCAKQLDLFEGHDRISVDLLKVVRDFVRGYEVEGCPLSLWERAILQGYEVFRQLKSNDGGIVIGDRLSRSVRYRAI